MALIQTVHLSMANFKSAPVVPAVQNDTDRQVKMIIDDYTLTSGLTGKIAFERSDGTHYETAAELVLADNAFTADIDQALTQPGRTMVQLKVTDTLTVSSFSFVIFVEADNSGTVTPQEGIDLVTAVEAAESAADRAESAASMFDEDVQGYVDEWLDEHPEATTTVLDGAITYAKLNDSLKAFVTPEMFGAVGDGVTDDTNALRSCIASNNYVLLKGTYLITGVLNFYGIHDFVMCGGKIVRPLNATYNTIVGDHCDNVTISNVEFDGNGNDRTMSYTWKDNFQACIILASQSRNIFIEKCKVKNYNYGIFILGADEQNTETSYENTALNGVIRDCTFYNCNSAIDTYGKGLLIDHNMFYGITNHAIQIEPNYASSVVDNPLDDTNYYTSAFSCILSNNLLIDIADTAILVHGENTYSVSVCNNTIVDFFQAIHITDSAIKYAVVQGNYIYYQKTQSVDADTRPWAYKAAIETGGGFILITGNHIWKAYVSIYARGKESVINNVIESPIITAIVFYAVSSLTGEMTNISENMIKNHVRNTSAFWGARAIVIGSGTNLILKNNFVETDAQPIYRPSDATAIVVGLVSTTAQTEAITAPSGFSTYSNLS